MVDNLYTFTVASDKWNKYELKLYFHFVTSTMIDVAKAAYNMQQNVTHFNLFTNLVNTVHVKMIIDVHDHLIDSRTFHSS